MKSYIKGKTTDKIGRIKIPADIRKALGIRAKRMLNTLKNGETIRLNEYYNNIFLDKKIVYTIFKEETI